MQSNKNENPNSILMVKAQNSPFFFMNGPKWPISFVIKQSKTFKFNWVNLINAPLFLVNYQLSI